MTRKLWLFTAGTLLLAMGLTVPPSVFIGLLDPESTGTRLQQLRAGVWLFKALLCCHGLWLLFSWLRSESEDQGAGESADRSQSQGMLWQPVRADDEEGGVWTTSAALVVLVAIGAILRWIGIHQDLWHDEVFTLIDFVRPHLGRILSDYSSDNQHLLYSVLAHGSIAVFGESAAALRLPAFVLGLASLWATFRLGSLTVGRRQAILAAALLTVSYHHVWFSQNARVYTGLLLMTALPTELFLRGLWLQRWAVWVAYASTVAIGMAFHSTMIFVAAAHGVALLGLALRPGIGARDMRRPLGALVLSGTLTLQIHAFVLPQMLELYMQPSAGADPTEFRWKSPVWLINETIRGLDIGLGFGWLGLAGGGLLVLLGFFSLLSRSRLTGVSFVLPAVLGGGAMVLLSRNLWPRFFFNSGAFAVLIAVQGAWVLGGLVARRFTRLGNRLSIAMASLLVVASMVTLPRVYQFPKQDFTGAREFVERNRRPGDRVLALDLAGDAYRAYHAPGMETADSLDELEAARASEGRTWILYTLGEHLKATSPALWQAIQTDYEEVRAFPGSLSGGTIVVRRSLDDGSGSAGSGSAGRSAGSVADELTDSPEEIHEHQ
jgi:hypothetical protein